MDFLFSVNKSHIDMLGKKKLTTHATSDNTILEVTNPLR